MKKLLSLTFISELSVIPALNLTAQTKQIHTNPDFRSLLQNERTLAILLFSASIKPRSKAVAKFTPKEISGMGKKGLEVQSSLETYFLNKKLIVHLQSFQQTNAILAMEKIYLTHFNNLPLHNSVKYLMWTESLTAASIVISPCPRELPLRWDC